MKIALLVCVCVLAQELESADAQSLTRASVSYSGTQGNWVSGKPSLSDHGRFVAFESLANNLVPGDFNGAMDIFVMDMSTGWVDLASAGLGGALPDNDSDTPTISSDGRYVVFESTASNLVSGDTSGTPDIFRRDRQTQTTERANLSSTGQVGGSVNAPSLSPDGNVVAFVSFATNLVANDLNGMPDVFVRDMNLGITELVSVSSSGTQGDLPSGGARLSNDGRFVAFSSDATTLAGGAPGITDVFLRDRVAGTTVLISVAMGGGPADRNSYATGITPDGRYIAFQSDATNLVAGDTNGQSDVFLRDTLLGTTELISVSSAGVQGNFRSFNGALSSNARFVTFSSDAYNLVSQPIEFREDVFLRDRLNATTILLTAHADTGQGDQACAFPVISADAHHIAFETAANNLIAGDANEFRDVLVWSDLPLPPAPTSYGIGKPTVLGTLPTMSINGSPSMTSIFQIQCTGARAPMPGLLMYGLNGPASLPFSGGTLYVQSPVRRTTGVSSAPYSQNPLNPLGSFAINMNAFAAGALGGNPMPALSNPGTQVNCQWWGRDGPSSTQLSNALEYFVAP